MGQNVEMTAIVLNVMPVGENDKRITLLTREQGKVTAFAKGARRPNSPLLAATNPFSFGVFEMYEGRNSYTVIKASISNYFRELSADYLAACYGFYFLEMADYYCQENNDEREMLRLLYQSLRALTKETLDNRLVRVCFELKAMAVNGEAPNVFACVGCGRKDALYAFAARRGGMLCAECAKAEPDAKNNLEDSVIYTMQYIISAAIEKLYTFAVSPSVLAALKKILREYRMIYHPHPFQSLKILEEMERESLESGVDCGTGTEIQGKNM